MVGACRFYKGIICTRRVPIDIPDLWICSQTLPWLLRTASGRPLMEAPTFPTLPSHLEDWSETLVGLSENSPPLFNMVNHKFPMKRSRGGVKSQFSAPNQQRIHGNPTEVFNGCNSSHGDLNPHKLGHEAPNSKNLVCWYVNSPWLLQMKGCSSRQVGSTTSHTRSSGEVRKENSLETWASWVP